MRQRCAERRMGKVVLRYGKLYFTEGEVGSRSSRDDGARLTQIPLAGISEYSNSNHMDLTPHAYPYT